MNLLGNLSALQVSQKIVLFSAEGENNSNLLFDEACVGNGAFYGLHEVCLDCQGGS